MDVHAQQASFRTAHGFCLQQYDEHNFEKSISEYAGYSYQKDP